MSTVSNAIVNRLITYQPLVALVANKVFISILPQNIVLPACRVSMITNSGADNLSGMSGLFSAEIQVDTWADKTPVTAQRVSEQVRMALQGYQGTHLNVKIRGIYLIYEMDGFEAEVSNYRIIQRYQVWYDRANPLHYD
jgi:hypothetical protein